MVGFAGRVGPYDGASCVAGHGAGVLCDGDVATSLTVGPAEGHLFSFVGILGRLVMMGNGVMGIMGWSEKGSAVGFVLPRFCFMGIDRRKCGGEQYRLGLPGQEMIRAGEMPACSPPTEPFGNRRSGGWLVADLRGGCQSQVVRTMLGESMSTLFALNRQPSERFFWSIMFIFIFFSGLFPIIIISLLG